MFLAGCKIQQSARACAGGVVERAADSRIIVNNISAATSNMHRESIEFDCGIRWRDIGPSDRRIRIVRRSKTDRRIEIVKCQLNRSQSSCKRCNRQSPRFLTGQIRAIRGAAKGTRHAGGHSAVQNIRPPCHPCCTAIEAMATAMQDVSPSFTSSPTSTMTTISTTTAATAAAAPKPDKPRKLRSACDACHRSKTRCSGGNPCTRCHEYMSPCTYSYSSRCGKPKGARSRKTLEREQRVAAAAESARIAGNPSALASLPATSTCTSTATAAATTTTKTTTTTTTIATTTAPSQGPAGDSAAAAAAATTSTVASPRADDCLGLFDDDEESNPFFSSGSENTGGTSFSPDWIPPLPSISDSDLSFPLLESCLGPDHDCNDSLFWSTTAEPDCQPTSKEPLDPRSKLLRSCKCLQTLSSLTARDIRRFDATFVFVRNYARAFSAFYHCSHCPKDAGSISMAVTALQLATTALEKTATAGTDAAGFKSGCSGMTAADLDEDLLTPGAELFLPANGRGASNPAFQLGSYQIAPLPGEPDLEEHSEILNILIRSAVRRLLAVCWQIWDLLRGPASRDGRGHVFEPYDPSSSSSSSSSSFSSGPEIHQLCDLSCSAEAAQFRSTLVQIPARLCNLLAL